MYAQQEILSKMIYLAISKISSYLKSKTADTQVPGAISGTAFVNAHYLPWDINFSPKISSYVVIQCSEQFEVLHIRSLKEDFIGRTCEPHSPRNEKNHTS